MSAFGWSAGDIVAAVKIVTKVAGALKEAGGASEEYQQTITDLETLQVVLQYLENQPGDDPSIAQIQAITAQSRSCEHVLRNFIEDFLRFENRLGGGAAKGWYNGAHRKAQWALFASKEITKLQQRMGIKLKSVQLLLQCRQLSVIHASRISQELKAEQQLETINDLKSGLNRFNDNITAETSKLTQHFSGLAMSTGNIEKQTESTHTLVLVERQEAKTRSVRINQTLDDIKHTVDHLGDVVRSSSTATSCSSSPKAPPTAVRISYQLVLTELARQVWHLLYLLGMSLRELTENSILLFPGLLLLVQSFYASMPMNPTKLLDSNLRFTDALGRTFSLDYQIFKSWQVFNALITSQFKGCPGEYHISKGKFYLFDRRFPNRLISGEQWSSDVKPDSDIIMSVGLSRARTNRNYCPNSDCKGVAVRSHIGESFTCRSCQLVFYNRVVRSWYLSCPTPMCTGLIKVFDNVDFARCNICKEITRTISAKALPNVEPPPFNSQNDAKVSEFTTIEDVPDHFPFEPVIPLHKSAVFTINRHPFKPTPADKIDVQTARSVTAIPATSKSLLEHRKQSIQTRLSLLEASRIREDETEAAFEIAQEKQALQALKVVHVIDDCGMSTTEPSEKKATVGLISTEEYVSAQVLLEARLNLAELMKQSIPEFSPRMRTTDGLFSTTTTLTPPSQIGSVFEVLEVEQLTQQRHRRSPNHPAEGRFIVISNGGRGMCLRISTHDGLGTTDPEVDSSKYAMIYMGREQPLVLPEENNLQPAIKVSSRIAGHLYPVGFDSMARVRLDKVYQIRNTGHWKRIGQVEGPDLKSLLDSFSNCFDKNIKLSRAAAEGKTSLVYRLLAVGASPNAVCGITGNALFEAIKNGHIKIAQILLEAGAAPHLDLSLDVSDCALHVALKRQNVNLVEMIVQRSICSICFKDANQKALLQIAANALREDVLPLRELQIWQSEAVVDAQPKKKLAMSPFCPQMWPLLTLIPASVINDHHVKILTRPLERFTESQDQWFMHRVFQDV